MALRLWGAVQNYQWGHIGTDSLVAKFAKNGGAIASIDGTLPYAELWLGSHSSGPSTVEVNGERVALSEVLKSNPALLGDELVARYGHDLPFLFKVLSVRTALSIQAHPNKTLAAQLHRTRPDVYKDPNHKPEMTVALTDFEALSGFRPLPEIAAFVRETPEFAELVGPAAVDAVSAAEKGEPGGAAEEAALKTIFAALMKAEATHVATQLDRLLARLSSTTPPPPLAALVSRLASQYPHDVGVFAVFLLNVINLPPGAAIFLPPDVPHAYLGGNCLECMATSDNVVRAGLTPKLRDVDTLIDMCVYKAGLPQFLTPVAESPAVTLLAPPSPPFDEFCLRRVEVGGEGGPLTAAVKISRGPRIVLCTSGKCTVDVMHGSQHSSQTISESESVFIPADAPLTFAAQDVACVVYVASCQDGMFKEE